MKSDDRFSRCWKTIAFCVIVASFTLLTFISNRNLGANVMPQTTPIELLLGEKGESFVRRLPSLATVDRQPAGLNFYTLRWPVKAMGSVVMKTNPGRLSIQNVISVTGTEDADYFSEGIAEITVNSAITAAERIPHDEARTRTYEYLRSISRQGWQATIPRRMARLRGKDMVDYMIRSGKITTLGKR